MCQLSKDRKGRWLEEYTYKSFGGGGSLTKDEDPESSIREGLLLSASVGERD